MKNLAVHALAVDADVIPVDYVRNPRARRYILRVNPEGTIRVTLPKGGTIREAWAFAREHVGWIKKQLVRRSGGGAQIWEEGTELLFRGEWLKLERMEAGGRGMIGFGEARIPVEGFATDWRKEVERHLWEVGWRELPARTRELAMAHGLEIRRVTVRDQRTRWGSCSSSGVISLNWRLVQVPEKVRDYIILHELMHLRVMDHSRRFWKCVAEVCPDYGQAEAWLRRNSQAVRMGRRSEAGAQGRI